MPHEVFTRLLSLNCFWKKKKKKEKALRRKESVKHEMCRPRPIVPTHLGAHETFRIVGSTQFYWIRNPGLCICSLCFGKTDMRHALLRLEWRREVCLLIVSGMVSFLEICAYRSLQCLWTIVLLTSIPFMQRWSQKLEMCPCVLSWNSHCSVKRAWISSHRDFSEDSDLPLY